MAHKDDLRESRKGTVINKTSSRQEKAMTRAVEAVRVNLESAFPGISIEWKNAFILKRSRRTSMRLFLKLTPFTIKIRHS